MSPSKSERNVLAQIGATLPSLLHWQVFFLFYLCGLLAWEYPWPCLVSLPILTYMVKSSQRIGIKFLYALFSFVLGLGAFYYAMPEVPDKIPEWMLKRVKKEVSGTVREILARPNENVRIVLDDVYLSDVRVDEEARDNAGASEDGGVVYSTENGSAARERAEKLPGGLMLSLVDGRMLKDLNNVAAPGDTIRLIARVQPINSFRNPGAWDYGFYMARNGVFHRASAKCADVLAGRVKGSQPGRLWSIRNDLRTGLIGAIPEGRGRGMLMALLLGDRYFQDKHVTDVISRASLAHSLALSGLHLAFVASMGWALAYLAGLIRPSIYLFLPRPKLALFLAVPFIIVYLWLGNYQPSLMRSALMFAFWGLLLFSGRGNVLLDGLFFALVVILVSAPLLVHDISLQFSALSVAGMSLFLSVLSRYVPRAEDDSLIGKVLRNILNALAISLSANFLILPLVIGYFGVFSPHLYLNLLWLPPLGFIVMPCGFIGMLLLKLPFAGGAGETLLSFAAFVSESMLQGLFILDARGYLRVFSCLRPYWPVYVGYFLLMVSLFTLNRSGGRIRFLLLYFALALLLAPSVVKVPQGSDSRVRLSLVDVGQGQAVLIEGRGKRVLIDGGGTQFGDFDVGKAALAPYLTYGSPPELDMVVLSHSDADHYKGLVYIIDNFRVGRFVSNGIVPQGQGIADLDAVLQTKGLQNEAVKAGDMLGIAPGLNLEILHPEEGVSYRRNNDGSLVVRLVDKGVPLALIPGDVEKAGQRAILKRGENAAAQVFILPHHGGKSAYNPKFYDAVNPRVVLVSSGFLNQYGMPNKTVKEELNGRGLPLYNTAVNGLIEIEWGSQPEEMKVGTFIPFRPLERILTSPGGFGGGLRSQGG